MEFTNLSVANAFEFVGKLKLSKKNTMIAHQILKEIVARLQFLADVGLDYLTLSRSSGTLSGGNPAALPLQIGSGLVGVLYILDEPSIGLHQRDNDKLLATLRSLTDKGNTLLGSGTRRRNHVCGGSYHRHWTCCRHSRRRTGCPGDSGGNQKNARNP